MMKFILLAMFSCLFSCQSYAYQDFESAANTASFLETLEEIRTLSDTDVQQALSKLKTLKSSLSLYPLGDQLEYHHLLAEVYTMKGQHRLAKSTAEQALQIASSLISPRIIVAKLSYDLGYSFEALGEVDIALEKYLSGLDVAESLEDQTEVANGLINIGAIYYQTNKLSEAIVALNEAATIAENLTDIELKGYVNSELGILYANLGEFDKATEYYQASYQYYTDASKPLMAINNLRNLAINYWLSDKVDQAIATYQRLLKELEPLQQPEMLFSAHIGLAQIYADENIKKYDLAMEHLDKTEQLVSQVEQYTLPMQFLVEKSSLLKEMKQYDEALVAIEEALTMFHQQKFNLQPLIEARLLVQRSEIYRLLGRYEEAYNTYQRVWDLNMDYFQSRQTQALAELRLEYESQRADIENNLLENRNKIDSLALAEAKRKAKDKQFYIYVITIITLIFGVLLQQLLKSQRQLLKLSRTDPLTEVMNRRRFIELSDRKLLNASNSKSEVAMLLIDCDNFKQVNDNYGHSSGDKALKLIATLGQEMLGEHNLFARLGGEEFIALLPGYSLDKAKTCAEKIRQSVESERWHEQAPPLTVSIGVTTTQVANSYESAQLFKVADEKLYQAKTSGRNQVCA